ncbi:hypothetical protein OG729_36130 [Streptomyces sp. NBC_00210]|uniref:hypothetical protein n=1 Tax=Streptomyces sp. NBC_00210 TaxID=2903636 RepID=UPI003243F502
MVDSEVALTRGNALPRVPVATGTVEPLGMTQQGTCHRRGEILRDDEHLGPPQGAPGCGLAIPDLVEAGTPWTITLSGVDSLAGLHCEITDIESQSSQSPKVGWGDGHIKAETTVSTPGLYRVTVRTMDAHTITQLVLASEPGTRQEVDLKQLP